MFSTRVRRFGKHLGVLAVMGFIDYFALKPHYGLGVALLLGFIVILLWFLFLMPTRCDFEVKGRGCRRGARGKVGGCHDHARDKRDALFAALRMRNPGMAFRVMWRDGPRAGRPMGSPPVPHPPGSAANRNQALFNAVSLLVAVISAVAGVLALFVGA